MALAPAADRTPTPPTSADRTPTPPTAADRTATGTERLILLSRHGQTEWNVTGRRQGRRDSPLTAQGLRDAARVAELAQAYPVDAIVASPLGRAQRTAAIVSAALHLPVTPLADLAEIDHGTFTGHTNDELDLLSPGWQAAREADLYRWRFPGGESYRDAYLRAGRALASAVVTSRRCPLLVAHGMLGRMLMAVLEPVDPEEALNRYLPHGTVLAFPVPPGRVVAAEPAAA